VPDISYPPLVGYDITWLFTTGAFPQYTSATAPAANTQYATRMVAPRPGTISDIAILIGATSSGNVDVAVQTFDGTTYTRAWSSGSTACPAANTWTSLGAPNVATTYQQVFYPTIAFDNATATPARLVSLGAAGWHQMSSGMTYPKLAWSKATSFPIPATTADSGVTVGAQIFAIGVKIT
jgi:hypothetical protein